MQLSEKARRAALDDLLGELHPKVEWFFNERLVARTEIEEPFKWFAEETGVLRADFVQGDGARIPVPMFSERTRINLHPGARVEVERVAIDLGL